MKVLLDNLLPKLFPSLNFQCVPHSGKSDLDRSIIDVLRKPHESGAKFVIVRDNDNADCYELKERLRQRCQQGGRDDTLIRIVCQELEAWYIGEPNAMAGAFGDERLRNIGRRARFRNPDTLQKPSEDVNRLVRGFRKIDAARRMAEHLTREGNRSHSFAIFLDGVANLAD